MPLYHFNVHCGDMRRESEGHEFLNLETAKREAVRLSGDMIRELGPEFWEGDGWALEVTDEGGAILAVEPERLKPDTVDHPRLRLLDRVADHFGVFHDVISPRVRR